MWGEFRPRIQQDCASRKTASFYRYHTNQSVKRGILKKLSSGSVSEIAELWNEFEFSGNFFWVPKEDFAGKEIDLVQKRLSEENSRRKRCIDVTFRVSIL